MTIDVRTILGDEQLMLDALKTIARENGSPLEGLFPRERPIQT